MIPNARFTFSSTSFSGHCLLQSVQFSSGFLISFCTRDLWALWLYLCLQLPSKSLVFTVSIIISFTLETTAIGSEPLIIVFSTPSLDLSILGTLLSMKESDAV